ncbi:MAG: hypothetical protein HY901_11190, partial [Deltaproteobacteria bacterium]|nr:hypothetical protein [Deltaproteobacteria bacterium]
MRPVPVLLWAALLAAGLLAACSESTTPQPDAGPTASHDAALPLADASAAGSDAGASGPDASSPVVWPDGSVSGTPLENVEIQWPRPLDLCNRWMEGNELSQEIARKVHVAIHRQERLGLQPWQLARARVDGVLVERGNLSSQRWRPAAERIGLSFRQYEVSTAGAYTSLQASIAHDLGAAGVLVESYQLNRNTQETGPLVVDGNSPGVGFHLELPGVAETISLEPCQGEADWDEAVEFLHAARGGRHLVIGRFMDTRASMAGSYPVRLRGVRLAFTDEAWLGLESGEFFAQTYAAQHHNWFEDSLIDFTQEPRLYHSVFRPISEGAVRIPATPERLVLTDLQGWDTPQYIDVTTRESDGTTMTERWDVQRGWVRVDDDRLTERASSECPGASVFLLGLCPVASPNLSGLGPFAYTDSCFQLLTCPKPAAPGYDLLGVVPVWFEKDPTLIGTPLDKTAITSASDGSGATGHLIRMGTYSVSILTSDRTFFSVEVKDAQGRVTTEYVAEKSELGPYPEPRSDVLSAANAAGDISMILERRWVGQAAGNSSINAPISFSLTFGGKTYLVDAMDRLRYTNTHHNWEDALEART